MAEEGKGFSFGDLGNWDWWTSEKDWLGPNTNYALAGMAKALNPKGTTGNVGEMMQRYIQGLQAQKAFKEQMTQRQEFYDALAAMLGVGGEQGAEALGAQSGESSSSNWLMPDRETYIQNRYGDSELADIARALGGR